jgi:hypothetical protein
MGGREKRKMQSITDFWKTATGKIAILGGGGVVA